MLERLSVVLHRPKFPENVGAAARACANMGVRTLVVVAPRGWDVRKARALATAQGLDVLSRMQVAGDLDAVLADHAAAYATTARTGGWRKNVITPAEAAPGVCACLAQGERVALVFGPEDTGLTNEVIDRCGQLLHIPAAPGSSSLNLAQAVLLVLYECFKQAGQTPVLPASQRPSDRLASHADQERLFRTLRDTLTAIDFLKPDNTDYWMLPVRRFAQRIGLRDNEYRLLMGICRQMAWVAGKGKPSGLSPADGMRTEPDGSVEEKQSGRAGEARPDGNDGQE